MFPEVWREPYTSDPWILLLLPELDDTIEVSVTNIDVLPLLILLAKCNPQAHGVDVEARVTGARWKRFT